MKFTSLQAIDNDLIISEYTHICVYEKTLVKSIIN